MFTRLLLYRLRTLLSVSAIWIVFGIVFYENLFRGGNDLGIQVSFIRFCLTFGIIGFFISAALIFFLKPAFSEAKLWLSTLLKLIITLFLFVLIAFLLLMIYFVLIYNGSFTAFFESFFTKIVRTRTFFSFIADMTVMTLLSIIFLEIMDKYGPGMFWSMLVGEFHKPIKQNRIFIFLYINESTSIAEELGHEKYFRMLRRFYRDITLPVLASDGEIYQYVGDEIVLSWINTPENKIKSLKFLRNTYYLMNRQAWRYRRRYGKIPKFKAGVHAGEVTAGFIGVIKRDLIYSGDTLNTAARIRSMCHELNESYLLSEDFVHEFHTPHGYEISEKGSMELKGRHEPIKLFAMRFE